MKKIIRITTVPQSLRGLLKGQFQYMSAYYEVIAISSPGEALSEVEQIEGVRTYSVEMTRIISPFKDLKSVYQLYKIFRKEKPYIVHTHTPKAGTVGMLAAWLAKVPFRLHTVAGLPLVEARGGKRILLNFVEKMTYVFATGVYPNSRGLNDIILNHKFCSPSKLKVIANGSSNGINTAHFDPSLYSTKERNELRASLGIDNDDFVFIFVGRLVRDKGVNELVEAFKSINASYPSTKLLMLGSVERELSPLMEETEKEIENNRSIMYQGVQRDIRPFLAISDLFVLPTYREGFPNVVMQAGSMGLASIVTDINGCNEIIQDGENGVLIPPKNTEYLRREMERLYLNLDIRWSMSNIARARIQDRYEQAYLWKSLLEEYEKMGEKNV